MEKHADYPVINLKVHLQCCGACPKRIKKGLLKMADVHSVDIDLEKDLVMVTGKADPMIVVKSIKKWGKVAELISYDVGKKNPNKQNNGGHKSNDDHRTTTQRSQTKGKNPKHYERITADIHYCEDIYCEYQGKSAVLSGKVPSKRSDDNNPTPNQGTGNPGYPAPSYPYPNPYPYPYPYPYPHPYPSGMQQQQQQQIPAYGTYSGGPTMPGNQGYNNYSTRAMPFPGNGGYDYHY